MNTQPENPPVDLSNCDREPIHLLGAIQPFGYLIATSMDWLIRHVSDNIGDVTGRTPAELLGLSLEDILPGRTLHDIRGRLQNLAPDEGSERIFRIPFFGDGRDFDCAIHISGDSIVIEVEPSMAPFGDAGSLVKSMITRLERAETLQSLFHETVRQLRIMTGFDRVMLYRFASDQSGEVVAESARRGLESYLGLNYPATDIPAQARALYVRNLTRIIADVGGHTVPVVPNVDPNGRSLDLSLSVTRAVSPIHIEYLTNMGVGASFSLSIVINGELWGLFAFHHYAPRRLSMELRTILELFGKVIGHIIESRLATEQRLIEEDARDLHDSVVGRLISISPSIDELIEFADEFRKMIPSDGFAVYVSGTVRTNGICPFPDEFPGLARFLNRAGSSRVYAVDELGAVYPKAVDFADRAAGLLAIPISRTPRDYLIFFRREIVETVTWAGDPTQKPLTYGPNGPRLSPRKSFEAWQETVRGRCAKWAPSELKSAEALRVAILEVFLRFTEQNQRLQNEAAQRQDLLIAELNHRVRNILGLVHAIVSQSRAGARSVDDFVTVLRGRIQSLARAHDQITDTSFSSQSLSDMIRTEFEAYVGDKASRVELSGPPIRIEAGAFSTLALVVHELVTNSAKYGALSDSAGTVEVRWHIDEEHCCVINWREHGGPAVQAPTRRGFGSTVIERSIPHELNGEAHLTWRLEGLEAEFTLPPDILSVSEPPAAVSAAKPSSAAGSSAPVKGLSVLLVEDNMIMALDAEEFLLERGFKAVHTALSSADALRVLKRETIDVALLDVNLGRETSFGLVEPLREAGIPFAFATGYGENIDFPENVPKGTVAIKKPYDADTIVNTLVRLNAASDSES